MCVVLHVRDCCELYQSQCAGHSNGFVLFQTTNKCAADYGGPAPMSEVETRHIMANFRANSPVIGSLDFHSYGQLILRPYGKTGNSSEHESLHRKIGSEMASRIKTVRVVRI